jgi:hypothetical protein
MTKFCILHIYLPFNDYINLNPMVVDIQAETCSLK